MKDNIYKINFILEFLVLEIEKYRNFFMCFQQGVRIISDSLLDRKKCF